MLTFLKQLVKKISRIASIDKAILFILLTKSWGIIAAPTSILLLTTYFSPEEQGFYYTFWSIISLQLFFELGFYVVIINNASHEWAHLSLDNSGYIIGSSEKLSRLVSLGRLIFKWYSVVSILFIILISTVGYIFFSYNNYSDIEWKKQWFVLVYLTGFVLWLLPFNALLEGCNQVENVNKFRLIQGIVSSIALWLTILLGGGLWSVVTLTAVKLLSNLILLFGKYRNFFKVFLKPPISEQIIWRSHIWPMQWRLGISGLFSFFAFSLFNPIMFHYHGAEVAGQMGLTWQLMNSLRSMALAWVQTKVPRMGMLIAKKNYDALDKLWIRMLSVSLIVLSAGSLVLFLLVYTLNYYDIQFSNRVLPPLPTAIFLFALILMHISQCESAYLFAHKRMPISRLAVFSSILIGILVWQLGSRFGPLGAAVGYLLVIALVLVPVETYIWYRSKSKWH